MRRKPAAALVALCLACSPALRAQESRLTINGYSSFEFEKQLNEDGGGDPNGSFDADLFDLVLNFQASDKVRVSADLTWEHGTATEEDFGNVAVEYAFVEYAFTDLAKVRVGKMFTPAGIFNEIHTAKPAFLSVKEPASTNKPERIVENAFRYFPRWGTGIAVRGDGVIADRDFSYDVFVANGAQEDTNPFEEDNNLAKSVTARFRFEPSESLSVGNSFYHDKIESDGVDKIVSDGLEFRYQGATWQIWAEAAFGWLTPEEGDTILQIGWHIQPSYSFDNGLTPYARIERVDPNTKIDNDHGYDFIVGINYEVAGGFMIKAENNYFKGASESTLAQYPNASYNEIKAAVVLGF
jgi:hypothetical protein